MIEIDNILISDEVIEKEFVCNLDKCKGGCCVDGDAGAPLTREEANIIEDLYPLLKPELSPRAIREIEEQGAYTYDDEFDIVTPVIDGGICVYGYYDENNIVKCAIEKIYYEGKTDFKKPISCHLYPIRITETNGFELVNYEPRKKLCSPACKLGEQLKVPVYQFLKEPIIRKYGDEVYHVIDDIAKEHYGK
ncbi:MAG: DUF3109 family protein [Taibaiella sp.]|nr:DUF3109 family protein [Taibaiella sp.]